MADINAEDLTEETAQTLDGSEQFVMFDSVEGKRGNIDVVGDYIAQHADADGQGHTAAQLAGGAQTDATAALGKIGDLASLTTTEKSTLVKAINEVDSHADTAQADATSAGTNASSALSKIGNLSSLDTTNKADLVGAVNEVKGQADDNTTALQTKANIDGAYEGMTVGNAEQLVSSVRVTDKTPYLFRTAGGNLDIGDRKYTTLVGADVAVNQLAKFSNINTAQWTSLDDSTLKAVADIPQNGFYLHLPPLINGHKYLFKRSGTASVVITLWYDQTYQGAKRAVTTQGYTWIWGGDTLDGNDMIFTNSGGAISTGETLRVEIYDLTAYFGSSTIADTAYTKEQATAGSGIAWLKANGFDFSKYRAYNAGSSLESVNPSAIVTRGFNQWDEEWEQGGISTEDGRPTTANTIRSKNFIPIFPNTAYSCSRIIGTDGVYEFFFYDANYNYFDVINVLPYQSTGYFTTPNNAAYMKFRTYLAYGTTYNHDICINLHWDGSRDGEYEQYTEHEYDLGNVPLHGKFIIEDGNIVAVGDTRDSGGTVNRKYAAVTYDGSNDENWTLENLASISTDKSYYISVQNPEISQYGQMVRTNSFVSYTIGNANLVEGNPNAFISISGNLNVYLAKNLMTLADFRTYLASHPLTIVYELATPTTDTADPFTNPQVVDNWGTEEFTTENDVPVGNETEYPQNLRDKLESIPNPPNGDGDYIVRQTGGTGEYRAVSDNAIIQKLVQRLPDPPSADGTYTLKATVSGGTVTYSWV